MFTNVTTPGSNAKHDEIICMWYYWKRSEKTTKT